VLKAKRIRSVVVLEDLDKLWFNASQKSSNLAKRLSRFAYRKLQLAIITKAIEYNVPVIFVDPRNTSTTCPKCGARLNFNHRLAMCRNCRFIADRDKVGAINIYFKAIKYLAPHPGLWGTHPMTDETRPKGGYRMDEPMTVYKKSYTII